MLLSKWRPYEVQNRFKDEIDKVFDNFFTDFKIDRMSGLYSIYPSTDIEESDNEYVITIELPGIDKKDIKLSLEGNQFTISGEKKITKEIKESNYISSERNYGSFQRTFDLPEFIKQNEIVAEYKDGILKVNLPKSEEVKKKEIQIKVK